MAPNFSKFYEDALKEGLGLAEFIERHHPGEAELKEIKPKMEMPYKGYFPSGKVCKIFKKDFFRWTDAITKYTKHQKLIDLIVRRLNRTHGVCLTKEDLVFTRRGSSNGNNHGGGESWIHPELMVHFLQWCCPEFGVEITHLFCKFCLADDAVRPRVLESVVPIETSVVRMCVSDERLVRDALADRVHGVVEYELKCGRADIVTSIEVIEVKVADKWKHALGQVLAYCAELPGRKPRIHLFHYDDFDYADVHRICGLYGCLVTTEKFDYK